MHSVPFCVSFGPVCLGITGGAWIIGYKAWGALLAQRLCRAGVVVCCLDYRNFPQVIVEAQMQCACSGMLAPRSIIAYALWPQGPDRDTSAAGHDSGHDGGH